jgi:asparagine synthase (glutamine-hydrolysing)
VSGLFGIVARDREARIDDADVEAMAQGVTAGDSGADSRARLPGVVLGVGSRNRVGGRLVETIVHGQRVVVAFHGTLYGSGVTTADEVLQEYLRAGVECLVGLRGDFALAIWDGSRDSAFLATDRFKIHPLLYYWDGARLVFASRMSGLLACPSVKLSIAPESIVDVVGSSVIAGPRTIFREVRKLPAGHVLEHHGGQVKVRPYWDVDFRHPRTNGRHLAGLVQSGLSEAVAVRLQADAPLDRVGTFLSGGIDSSTVTGLVAGAATRPITACSVGFVVPGFNEIDYARITARHFRVGHVEYFVTPEDVAEAVPIVLRAFDEPFANASAIPSYYCARLARSRGLDVLYAGDGGDELFAGNERYATQRLFDYYGLVPDVLRRHMIEPLVRLAADRLAWRLAVAGQKYIRRASIPYPDRLYSYAFFREMPLASVLDDGLVETLGESFDPFAAVRRHYIEAPASTELDRQLYVDLKLAIADNDVMKVTRMAEVAGVTVRYPFLDHRFVECAAQVPARLKMRGRRLRTFFKDAYRDFLHPDTIAKHKHGFGLPIAVWLRTDRRLNAMMHDLVLGPRAVQRGYFKRSALEDLVRRHQDDTGSYYGTILWNLMVLEAWHQAVRW